MGKSGQAPERSDREQSSGYGVAIVATLFGVLTLVILPFLPLLLSLLETVLFGTDYVEDACRRVGIHDELSWFYGVVFEWFH